MRVFLDECVDRRFAREIAGHTVRTAREMGWTSIKNGELLVKAAAEFDAFVTVDRNLAFQQNRPLIPSAVLVLAAPTNRLADLRPLVPALLKALGSAKKGEVVELSAGRH